MKVSYTASLGFCTPTEFKVNFKTQNYQFDLQKKPLCKLQQALEKTNFQILTRNWKKIFLSILAMSTFWDRSNQPSLATAAKVDSLIAFHFNSPARVHIDPFGMQNFNKKFLNTIYCCSDQYITDKQEKKMELFKTKRLKIRTFASEDIDNLHSLLSNPNVMRFYPQPLDLEASKKWLNKNVERHEKEGHGLWVVTEKEDNQFIGQCGLVTQRVENSKYVEVGYMIDEPFWNQGYATEAAIGAIQYARDVLGIKEVIALIDRSNIASENVAKKAGLKLKKEVEMWNKTVYLYSTSL